MNNWVYVGTDETKRFIKIGTTSDTERRQKEIQHMNPTYKMLWAYRPERVTAIEAERFWHSYFQDKRIVGEWFNLSIDDLLVMTGGRGKYKFMSLLGRRA